MIITLRVIPRSSLSMGLTPASESHRSGYTAQHKIYGHASAQATTTEDQDQFTAPEDQDRLTTPEAPRPVQTRLNNA